MYVYIYMYRYIYIYIYIYIYTHTHGIVGEIYYGYLFVPVTGDIGGSLGLLIGASVITLFEAADAFAIALASRRHQKNRRPQRSSTQERDTEL